ncbi:MAG: winged helix-turn-helix transcriptional regulator [Haloarculaceae archaeon]
MSTQPAEKTPEPTLSPADYEDLPDSAKRVIASLRGTDGRTTRELAGETDLAERTIRYALTRLDDMGVIQSRYLLSNPQTCQYELVMDDDSVDELLTA